MSNEEMKNRIKSLPLWQGNLTITPLTGGMTNVNFKVQDESGCFVARMGDDIPLHQVMRFNELAAGKAAYQAGVSPEIVFADSGITVLKFIEGKTLSESDVRQSDMLSRILDTVKVYHREVPKYLRGPSLAFWVFHVIRDYAATLEEGQSPHRNRLPEFLAIAESLESAAAPFDIVFGHNDLLCGNFLDDGKKLWLIDFDYAGFNTPLFDLGGLSSNNGLTGEQELWVLENYFEAPATQELLHRFQAMKCASLLRETMWSMVSELTSTIDFDYSVYTAENLARFTHSYQDFKNT